MQNAQGVRNEPHPEPRAHVTTGRGARDNATRGAVRRQNAYGSAARELDGSLGRSPRVHPDKG